ncbi:MAG TPA: YbaB/EbfC family nucleoid-associated protein [Gemmatales bacterium]|nr:YbaB/EbfC family nucleoid-associated protein [Gemmatales bacterium]
MFKELSAVMGLLKNPSKMQAEVEKMQQRINQITAEGAAGGNMVTVKMNGKMEVLSCSITDAAWQMQDRELIEDLVRGATNQAMEKVKALVAEETARMTQSIGLPAGMGMPDLGGLSGLMGS